MRRWIPVLAWAGLIFLFSSLSQPPGASSSELRHDLAHTGEYLVLALLLFPAVRGTWPAMGARRAALVTWLACALYALSDEYHQSFVPGRDSSLFDVGFDCLGAAFGTVLSMRLRWTSGRRTS
ncbi:MAG: VanZ family protein [Thermoflexaceae bacterium]|nr:VanZ family protein [Thermoflexaceae bacterium]